LPHLFMMPRLKGLSQCTTDLQAKHASLHRPTEPTLDGIAKRADERCACLQRLLSSQRKGLRFRNCTFRDFLKLYLYPSPLCQCCA
jgi:hypothetical protein